MAHEFLVGKPFLILANKQDLPESVDCIDICEYLDVEYLANRYRCPCLVEASGCWGDSADESNEYDGLNYGVQWLVKTVLAHRQFIMNRINFHKHLIGLERNDESDRGQHLKRPRTAGRLRRRKSEKACRPKTAPSSQLAWLEQNDNNYLIKRNSVVSVKSIPSSSSTQTKTSTERTVNSISKPPTTDDGLSVVDEGVENSRSNSVVGRFESTLNQPTSSTVSAERPPIITTRKEEMTLEDLSLSFSVNELNGKAIEIS